MQNKLVYYTEFPSPVGMLLLRASDRAITGLFMQAHRPRLEPEAAGWRHDEAPFREIRMQLEEYFSGVRRQFDLELDPRGTPFQLAVWKELSAIPFGRTITYAEQARRIGNPGAVRAVGLANGANPISIIIPCHRVIGSNGSLTGYGGGLANKRLLLELESRHSPSPSLFEPDLVH